jgi:hypothetical protein
VRGWLRCFAPAMPNCQRYIPKIEQTITDNPAKHSKKQIQDTSQHKQ